jgi:hypothetical protein
MVNQEDMKNIRWRIGELERHREIKKSTRDERALPADTKRALESIPRLLTEDFEELGADLIYITHPGNWNDEGRRVRVNLMAEIFRACKK